MSRHLEPVPPTPPKRELCPFCGGELDDGDHVELELWRIPVLGCPSYPRELAPSAIRRPRP